MTIRSSRGLSGVQKAELWERWRCGQSLSHIARALEKHAGSVFMLLQVQGGVYRPPRQRASAALSLAEREEISRGLAAGESIRGIASTLGRSPSTVSREIARNGGPSRYRAAVADQRAWDRGRRPKRCKLADNRVLRRIVAKKLSLDWSPDQIAGWLKRVHPDNTSRHICHETIYRSLFIQTRGVLKKELLKHLRSRRVMRHARNATTKGQPRGQIIDAISIRQRPASVKDRAIPGHWEGDLIAGSKNTHIATLVERQSRFTLLVKVSGKDSNTVVSALIRQAKKLPEELRLSLTWDRGTELARHERLTIATDLEVYFCDPQSPWQRGTNENTNGLLRQYFPKDTDLSGYSQQQLNAVARRLNERPRKTLGYQSPADILQASVAATS